MNFISEMEGEEMRVELKYCERCGGLWLRPQGTEGVYCGGCEERLETMPDPGEAPSQRSRRRKARLPEAAFESEAHGTEGWLDKLEGVAAMEVRA
jgi:Zn-finger nucleic acid-binding protein